MAEGEAGFSDLQQVRTIQHWDLDFRSLDDIMSA